MTQTNDLTDECVVSHEDAKKFLRQVVDAAGDGIEDGELRKAFDQFTDLIISAAMIELWHQGRMTLAWNTEAQDLTLKLRRMTE